jgi:hypothetical protein
MSIEDVLAGSTTTVTALERRDVATWQLLFDYLLDHEPPEAPENFVSALLDYRSSPSDWLDAANEASNRCNTRPFVFHSDLSAAFRDWFAAGVQSTRAATDPAALEIRFAVLNDSVPDEAFALTTALVADARLAWSGTEDLLPVLLLLQRRALEEHAYATALDAATEAEALAIALGDSCSAGVAKRARGATLLRAGRLNEAFETLDPLLTEPGPLFGGSGASVSDDATDLRECALDEAATVARWCDATTPEWVRALGGIAERFSDPALGEVSQGPALWERFEKALDAMVAASVNCASDLEVVIRQATQREFTRTADAASKRAR